MGRRESAQYPRGKEPSSPGAWMQNIPHSVTFGLEFIPCINWWDNNPFDFLKPKPKKKTKVKVKKGDKKGERGVPWPPYDADPPKPYDWNPPVKRPYPDPWNPDREKKPYDNNPYDYPQWKDGDDPESK